MLPIVRAFLLLLLLGGASIGVLKVLGSVQDAQADITHLEAEVVAHWCQGSGCSQHRFEPFVETVSGIGNVVGVHMTAGPKVTIVPAFAVVADIRFCSSDEVRLTGAITAIGICEAWIYPYHEELLQ
jgi:hypothetical protein